MNATGTTFLSNVRLLNDAVCYQSCDDVSVGSAVLENTTLNTSTVAYYTGTTPGSIVCFVCDKDSGYALNTTSNTRVCQSDATWSGSPTTCGELAMHVSYVTLSVHMLTQMYDFCISELRHFTSL